VSLKLKNGFNAIAKATAGAPTTGTWAVGDVVCDSVGEYFRCTVAGTPGTWSSLGSVALAADREVSTTKPPASSDSRLRNPFTINYIKNPDSEADTNPAHVGWVEYADAAGTQPVNGTGGSPVSALTGAYSDTALRGSKTFHFIKVTGASRQGEGFSYDFTIDGADKNRSLTVAFECLLLGAGYTAGDMSVWVYDVTNSRLCPISANSIAGPGRFSAQFSTSDSTSYRLCMHVSSTFTGEWQMRFDDFYVGPTYLPSAPAMSDWQDGGAVTIEATTTNPTKGTVLRDKVWWRRVGDSAEIRFEYEQSTGGSAGSGDYLWGLPAGLSIDLAKVQNQNGTATANQRGQPAVGVASYADGAVGMLVGSVAPYDATRVRLAVLYSGANNFINSAICDLNNANSKWSATFTVPISGWSGTTAVQPGSRYLWAQRFAANAVRVTSAPSKPGEYRAQRSGVDTAPTTAPTAADGARIDSNTPAGRINRYYFYVGPGKVVQPVWYQTTGRSGNIIAEVFYVSAWRGIGWTYDPATGVVTVLCGSGASDLVGIGDDLSTTYSTGYFDILIADDPVPVALAPAVYVEASSDAGQVLTANVSDIQFEDKVIDTHGAWSGTVFTAPVAGIYDFYGAFYSNGAGVYIVLWYNGNNAELIGYIRDNLTLGLFHGRRKMAAGDTIKFRSNTNCTRDNSGTTNWLRITRIGDA
jgi:hypothetical protein